MIGKKLFSGNNWEGACRNFQLLEMKVIDVCSWRYHPTRETQDLVMCACMCVKSLQFCLTLCNPMDWRPPGFSVHGILQPGKPSVFCISTLFLCQNKAKIMVDCKNDYVISLYWTSKYYLFCGKKKKKKTNENKQRLFIKLAMIRNQPPTPETETQRQAVECKSFTVKKGKASVMP